ncbi:MAG TPA: CHASE3 domain-containing protein [Steroidobacteraceae bacterium]|jgi:signal transduction histidine kinase|nr:CHASE3 domain-containing protein [Steroidobacteraceae bacterium]
MTPQPASRLSYAPILLGIAFIATLFMVAESGYKRIHEAGLMISAAEERQALVSRYLRLVLDAETSQRGFLLTEDPRYLRGFDPAIRALDPMLDRLVAELRESGFEEDANRAQNLRSITGQKINEMQSSLRLYGEVSHAAALQLLDTDIGQRAMTKLRHELRELWNLETQRLEEARASSEKDLQTSRVLLGAASFLSLILVVLVGALLGRDLRQREAVAENLGARNRELDRTVQQRTAMLFHLSSSLQKVAEREKAGLARELHDELGGLLVATKIDVSWLRKHIDDGSETAKLRWERVLKSLDEGLSLKRRVIESLRPTLLDNVGLVAALRWLTDETLRRQGITCEEQYPESMPELSPDARIAVFRVIQECLMNIVKHAKAKSVLIRLTLEGDLLSVVVRDDGVGIDESRIETPQSHGLLGMRHRVESLDGSMTVKSLGTNVGTECRFSLRLERIRNTGTQG